jgi:hypothetical protein
MEGTGAAKIVSRLFANVEDKCYVANLVTDDDSSVRKILTHSYRELVDALKMTEAEWPRFVNGRKRPDNGLLPLLHAIIKFLADKGHRVRGYASFLFVESVKSILNGCGCTKKVDAERFEAKRRLSWTLRLHSCFGRKSSRQPYWPYLNTILTTTLFVGVGASRGMEQQKRLEKLV